MDQATLKYMGQRVDEARKLKRRIDELDELLEHLDQRTKVLFRAIVQKDLGDKEFARLSDDLAVVVIDRISEIRHHLCEELEQL